MSTLKSQGLWTRVGYFFPEHSFFLDIFWKLCHRVIAQTMFLFQILRGNPPKGPSLNSGNIQIVTFLPWIRAELQFYESPGDCEGGVCSVSWQREKAPWQRGALHHPDVLDDAELLPALRSLSALVLRSRVRKGICLGRYRILPHEPHALQ